MWTILWYLYKMIIVDAGGTQIDARNLLRRIIWLNWNQAFLSFLWKSNCDWKKINIALIIWNLFTVRKVGWVRFTIVKAGFPFKCICCNISISIWFPQTIVSSEANYEAMWSTSSDLHRKINDLEHVVKFGKELWWNTTTIKDIYDWAFVVKLCGDSNGFLITIVANILAFIIFGGILKMILRSVRSKVKSWSITLISKGLGHSSSNQVYRI